MPFAAPVYTPAAIYRIREPVIALSYEPGGHIVQVVPAGAFVTVGSAAVEDGRLADVSWGDKVGVTLTQDLRARADPVGDSQSGSPPPRQPQDSPT